MATITTRAGKGSPLTNTEVDDNFTNLNTDKAELSGAAFTGAITTNSTVDGRDVATDGTKLDGIEASADVTDATNVTAAGALMDSEVTNLAEVKAFASSDYATAAQGTTADAALPKSGGAMTGAITTNSTFDGRDVATDGTKLDTVETNADVTDTTNVTAAGALMDSELTSIASVKALDQGVATTDSPTFAAITGTTGQFNTSLNVNGTATVDGLTVDSASAGRVTLGTFTNTTNAAGTEASISLQNNQVGCSVNLVADRTGANFGSDFYIENADNTGTLKKRLNVSEIGDISFYEDTGTTPKFFWDASAESLALSGTGGLDISGDIDVDGVTNLDVVDIDGAVDMASTLTVTGEITANGGIALGDNDKATFGAGDDLQIYHNGTDSYILDGGTGDLKLLGSSNVLIGNTASTLYFKGTSGAESRVYYSGSTKLATTSTGIDVTGTATMDGLVVANTAVVAGDFDGGTAATYIRLQDDTDNFLFGSNNSLGNFLIKNETADALRLSIANTGDISFYEDTGTTPKLFWDASAESLGIGTSSPSSTLDVVSSSTNSQNLAEFSSASGLRAKIASDGGDDGYLYLYDSSDANTVSLRTDGNASFINGGGNLGIGTSLPDEALEVSGDVKSNGGNFGIYHFGETSDVTKIVGRDASHGIFPNTMEFYTNSVNRMTIDASGNVGIGTASPSAKLDVVGDIEVSGTGGLAVTGDYSSITAGTSNLRLGVNAGNSIVSGGNYNTVVGDEAGTALTTGVQNTAIGYNSLSANTTGASNVAVGYSALSANTTGASNVAIGLNAADSVTTGSSIVAIGENALGAVAGTGNIAIGANSGAICTGEYNIFMGVNAGDTTTSGNRNIIIGTNCDAGAAGANNSIVIGDTVAGVAADNFTFGNAGTDSNIAFGATVITAPSDSRLKEDVATSTAGLSFINDLRPVTYKWKKEKDIPTVLDAYVEGSETRLMNDNTNHGFIAQEVKAAIDAHPELKDGFDMWMEKDSDGQQRVAPSALVPMLVKAIQELTARITTLEG